MGLRPEDLVLYVWRLSNHPDLGGRGGLISSGRWHTAGRSIVYTADEITTAFAELDIRLSNASFLIPARLLLLKISVPIALDMLDVQATDLPEGWSKRSPRGWRLCQPVGNRWLQGNYSAVMKVPSAARLGSYNFLLNPVHQDMERIRLLDVYQQPFPNELVPSA